MSYLLADAADLKSAGRKAMGVQVPLRAPNMHLQNQQHADGNFVCAQNVPEYSSL